MIQACIDGDRTEIPGRDCWQDPRIVDGVSLRMRYSMVSAVFDGLQPLWGLFVVGDCSEGPPEPSAWDPR